MGRRISSFAEQRLGTDSGLAERRAESGAGSGVSERHGKAMMWTQG